jgi:hypothetical protein
VWLSLRTEPEVRDVLGHHWEPGEATIIACQEEHEFSYWPDDASARTYVVDVRPASGAPAFRTEVRRSYKHREAMNPESGLGAGELITVDCDPKHEKAKFDESDPRLYKDGQVPGKGHQSPLPAEAAFEAAAAAPPGTPVPAAAAPNELAEALGSGPVADILQQLSQDPEGFRAQVKAQGSGASAFVVTDAGLAPVGPTPAGQQTDVADQLTKLAALRDSGVLTDAEFEAQKQKLLGT